MSDADQAGTPEEAARVSQPRIGLSALLFALTCASTTLVGSTWSQEKSLLSGLAYSVPLMAILLSHEFGHYIAARIHRVPASLPYFIPMPVPPMGTMGAVIFMPQRIRSRDALLDIGAAGPLAGLIVALPVLAYGILQSPIELLPQGTYLMEGRSLLYLAMLYALKGPIPDGYDIMLGPTAFAGWAGLLVTMLNLIPALQLDGGHVAYSLFGERYELISRRLRRSLLAVAVAVGLAYGLPAYNAGVRGDALWGELMPASQWLMWWFILSLMARTSAREHPPTDPGMLSPKRRIIAWVTLLLFVVLFMPAWLRQVSG